MKTFSFTGETLEEARNFLASRGIKEYRAGQVFGWIFRKNVFDFDEMTDLPADLRSFLKENTIAVSSSIVKTKVSKKDSTIKYLIKLHDGSLLETVFLQAGGRRTVCLSSQVGCPLGCAFCATGKSGFKRNLLPDEIVGQFLLVNRDSIKRTGQPLTNIVVMGMGEPFLNYNNLIKGLNIISSQWGAGVSARRITVSTSGVLTGIDKYAAEEKPYKLSISLHSPFDTKRRQLIPLNRKYSLRRLMEAVYVFTERTGKIVTFQYLLMGGFNDTVADAKELVELTSRLKCKVNLIVYNKVPGLPFRKPSEKAISKFMLFLQQSDINVTRRRSMGEDIESGCGQLRQRHVS